jgi:hypothetical protein
VAPYSIEKSGTNGYIISRDNRIATMKLQPEKTRQIASLKLPLTEVSIEFENFSEDHYASFMKRFRQHLQRGGG